MYSIDASDGDLLYIGGEFVGPNATGFRNIVSYNNQLGQLFALDNNTIGLNGKVSKLLLSNTSKFQYLHNILNLSLIKHLVLYVGGDFNATMTNLNLKHVGQFDTAKKLWSPLGDVSDDRGKKWYQYR